MEISDKYLSQLPKTSPNFPMPSVKPPKKEHNNSIEVEAWIGNNGENLIKLTKWVLRDGKPVRKAVILNVDEEVLYEPAEGCIIPQKIVSNNR